MWTMPLRLWPRQGTGACPGLPDDIRPAVTRLRDRQVSPALVALARKATERALHKSELRELRDGDPDWLAVMNALIARLR